MPAYRSSDEADIRTDVVAHIRMNWPSARIIHEINVSGQGSNRIDVLAVAPEAMLAVEIKSKKDKLDRLPEQIKAMRRATPHCFAAIHEKFLVPEKCNPHYAVWEKDGAYFRGTVPRDIRAPVWVWPKRNRSMHENGLDSYERWGAPAMPMARPLPDAALEMLWANELRQMCADLRIGVSRTTVMSECVRLLRWQATGAEITRGICAALRRRECVEADPVASANHSQTTQGAR
jgi:hypothetical protein